VTADAARETVSHLARSDHRVTVLRALAGGSSTRRDLHEETGISQPTLGRVFGDFEDRGWVERRGQEHALTPSGELIYDEFRELLEAVATVQRLGDVVAEFPAEELEGLELRALADATVHRPEPGDTLSHIRRMENVWFEADTRRLLGNTLGPASIDERKRQARTDLAAGRQLDVETIVSTEMVAVGMADPELRAIVRENWDPERMRSYLYDGPVPMILLVADNVVMLGPTGENGIPTAAVESTDERVRAWVEGRLDDYRARSTEVSIHDLPL
jgi:predicted transcriptional regulator